MSAERERRSEEIGEANYARRPDRRCPTATTNVASVPAGTKATGGSSVSETFALCVAPVAVAELLAGVGSEADAADIVYVIGANAPTTDVASIVKTRLPTLGSVGTVMDAPRVAGHLASALARQWMAPDVKPLPSVLVSDVVSSRWLSHSRRSL